jgi:hypothetical protein
MRVNLFAKMEAGQTRQGLASMEGVDCSAERKFPFEYAFADENTKSYIMQK